MIDAVGYIAVATINLAYVWQIVKMVRTKKARDISIPFFSQIMVGVAIYLCYAIAIGNQVYMVANTLALVLPSVTIALSFKYKRLEVET